MADNSYGETVGALDKLRKKQIEDAKAQRQKEARESAELMARSATGTKPSLIKSPLEKLTGDSAAAAAAKEIPDVSIKEAQLANLQLHANKTLTKLQAAHGELKGLLALPENEQDEATVDRLTKTAVALKKKLDYFKDVGIELESGQTPDWGSMFPFSTPKPYEGAPANVPAAQQFRKAIQ
jgi:hypothetical protein